MSRDKPLTLLRHCDKNTAPITTTISLAAKVEIHWRLVQTADYGTKFMADMTSGINEF